MSSARSWFIMNVTKNKRQVSVLRSLLAFTAYETAAGPRLTTFSRELVPKSISWPNKETSTEKSTFSQLYQSSFAVTCSIVKRGRAMMAQYVLPTRLKRRRSQHSCWQISCPRSAYWWSEYKKCFNWPPANIPAWTIWRTKIIYIEALPSYNNNACELCFCKAMIGSACQKTFKCNQVFVLFAIKSVPVSLTKSLLIYASTGWVFFDHAIRHRSWMLVKAEKGCFLFFCFLKKNKNTVTPFFVMHINSNTLL